MTTDSVVPAVYIVDHDPEFCTQIRNWLESDDLRVENFQTTEALMDASSAGLPDSVCLIMEPEEALSLLKKKQQRVPIIVLANDKDPQTVACAMDQGAYDYVTIPINGTRLITTVRNAVAYSQLSARLSSLESSEERYRALFESAEVGMYRATLDGSKVLAVNQKVADIFGIKKEEILSTPASFRWENPADRNQMIGTLKKYGLVHNFEARILTADDEIKTLLLSGNLIPQKGWFEGTLVDITEHKRAEQELHKAHDFAESLVNTAQVVILMLDTNGKIVHFNRFMEKLSGYSLEEVKDKDWFSTFLPVKNRDKIRTVFKETVEDILTEGTVNSIVKKNGMECSIEWHNKTLKDADGNVKGVLAVGMDITDRLAMVKRLGQSEKMKAIGLLSGGIAHDFNNILGGVIGYAEMTIDEAAKGSRIENNAKQILKAGERAKSLVEQILSFSQRSDGLKKTLYLEPIINKSVGLLRATLPSSVEIISKFEEGTKPVLVDAVKIHEIIMNLCTNAAHAMSDSGILEISLGEKQLNFSIEGRLGEIAPGTYSVITIKDNGHGMSGGELTRIFEPFYTTKEVGKGTGMGLAVVFGVVQSHGGNITIDSEQGVGTTFKVFIPKKDKSMIVRNNNRPNIQGGTEKIMYVDDEEILTEMTSYMLSDLGYKVLSFNDANESIQAFEKDPDSFDLVITDQTMPNISGFELSKKMLRIRNDIPIIICTGHSKYIDKEKVLAAGIKGLLMKPMGKKEFTDEIRSILDERKR